MLNNNLPSKILVIDDDMSVTSAVETGLNNYNINVVKAHDLETALYQFNQHKIDVALVELEFGPLNGLAIAQKWRNHLIAHKRTVTIIFTSGNNSAGQDAALIKELGDFQVINKPIKVVSLLPFLSRAMQIKKQSENFEEFKTKILKYYEDSGDFAKAATALKSKVENFGSKGLSLLYELYEKGGKLEDALDVVTSLMQKKPEDISLINAKGRLLLRLGRTKEALSYIEKADRLAPGNIERLNDAAEMYLKLNRPLDSIEKYKQLIALNPENPDLKFDFYGKLYANGFEQEAMDFGKQTSSPKEIVRHYNNKGVLLSKENRVDEAIEEYERALKFFPNYRENYRIYFNMALAYTSKKNRESFKLAEEKFLKCLELSPGFEKAERGLQTVQNTLNNVKKAV